MSLSPGTRLGPYEVTAAIGAGGMGEVYRATDTKLKRSVAIKVLPGSLAADPDRLARFQREAEVLAALNHPHIAQVYGFEDSTDVKALVMELVEGPTLDDVIAGRAHSAPAAAGPSESASRGPAASGGGAPRALNVDEALAIARQIADALEAAHDRGVIHRDLKPANIKVRDDGTVKVLDFGLAKAVTPDGAGAAADANSPTLTSPAMTRMGMILGTAAYMSPEQAKGRPVDKRADIWAFGCVLFEMLTGQRAFEGDEITEVLASVIKSEPDWTRLPANVPPVIVTFLRRCLVKDPRQRLHDIADFRLALEGAFDTAGPAAAPAALPAAPRWQRPAVVAAAVAALTLIIAALVAWIVWPRPKPAEVARFELMLPAGQQFRNTGTHVLSIARDGRAFVYNAQGGLYLRRLSEPEAHVIPGTEGALTSPFFSPDGQEVAFWLPAQTQTGRLVRIATGGGAPVEVASSVVNIFGGSWEPDGTILFGQAAGIMRVPASGGTPEVVIAAANGEVLGNPQRLPDGKTILFARFGPGALTGEIDVEATATHKRTRLLAGAADARYVPSGHLVYLAGDSLLAAPFDVDRLQVGAPVPVLRVVSHVTPLAQYAVADNGTLVYSTSVGSPSAEIDQLTWFNRKGDRLGTIGQSALIANFDLAPNGRVVTQRATTGGTALWMADAEREWPLVPADFRKNGFISDPAFSPSGDRVAFSSGVAGNLARIGHQVDRIYVVPADGGAPQPLYGGGDRAIGWLEDWSPDGKQLLLLRNAIGVAATLGRDSASDEVVFEQNAPRLDEPAFSPDGRWIAYHADRAAGGLNVYVVPYPPTGQVYKASDAAGGSQPRWRQDGRELFYLRPDGTLMSVTIETTPAFHAGLPTALFRPGLTLRPGFDQYAVADNGQRFLVPVPVKADQEKTPASIDIVVNWFEELKRLAPAR